jgi:hypothetical protein
LRASRSRRTATTAGKSSARSGDDSSSAPSSDLEPALAQALEPVLSRLDEAEQRITDLLAAQAEQDRVQSEFSELVQLLPTADQLRAHDARAASRRFREKNAANAQSNPTGPAPGGLRRVSASSPTTRIHPRAAGERRGLTLVSEQAS